MRGRRPDVNATGTSGNAVKVVESLGTDRVLFLPDEYLAKYVAGQTEVEVIGWHGHCEVHERFTGDQVDPDGLTQLDTTIRLYGDGRKHRWYAVLAGFGEVVFRDSAATAVTCGQQKQAGHGQKCTKATGKVAK